MMITSKLLYIEISIGMEKIYGKHKDAVLCMNAPVYRTRQAASCFYKTLVSKTQQRGYAVPKRKTRVAFGFANGNQVQVWQCPYNVKYAVF
jgi:hypothetical protein